jgi:hypothetical protein
MDAAGAIFLFSSIFVFFEVGQCLLSFQSFILRWLHRVPPAPIPLIDAPIGKPGDFPIAGGGFSELIYLFHSCTPYEIRSSEESVNNLSDHSGTRSPATKHLIWDWVVTRQSGQRPKAYGRSPQPAKHQDPVGMQVVGTVHGRKSVNRGEGGHLHTVSFGRRLRDFRYRPNLALRDFGLLESGREDKKRLISGFYFYYAVARWQAGSCHYCGYLLSFLAASKGLRAMELSPLLARLRYRNTNTERP